MGDDRWGHRVVDLNHLNLPVRDAGANDRPPAHARRRVPRGVRLDRADEVTALHQRLTAAGVTATPVDDRRPADAHMSFRCWDPDGTEVEVYWQSP